MIIIKLIVDSIVISNNTVYVILIKNIYLLLQPNCRDDRCVSDNGREGWYPYLAEEVVALLQKLPMSEVCGRRNKSNRQLLFINMKEILPSYKFCFNLNIQM